MVSSSLLVPVTTLVLVVPVSTPLAIILVPAVFILIVHDGRQLLSEGLDGVGQYLCHPLSCFRFRLRGRKVPEEIPQHRPDFARAKSDRCCGRGVETEDDGATISPEGCGEIGVHWEDFLLR